jgi:hypothetical protein
MVALSGELFVFVVIAVGWRFEILQHSSRQLRLIGLQGWG